MLLWKSWFDLRVRFCYLTGSLLAVMAAVLASYSTVISRKPKDGFGQELFKDVFKGYFHYVDVIYFLGNVYVILLLASIILSSASILSRSRQRHNAITLSLPLKRWHWIAAHAGATAFLILALAFIASAGAVAGSRLLGRSYPFISALRGAAGLWLACIPWIGLSLLLNSYIRSSMRAALVLILFSWIGLNMLILVYPSIDYWSLRRLSDPGFWQGQMPWLSISAALSVAVGATALAAWRFNRQEL